MPEHSMTAKSYHEQCPFATPNGDPPSVLNCGLKEGHERFGYAHVDGYEATAGTVKSWHKKWFRLPEDELLRLRAAAADLTISLGVKQ